MKLTHYRKKCIGCNSCVEQAPDFWEISASDGKANLKGGNVKNDVWTRSITTDEIFENQKAAKDCPMRIIKISLSCSK